MAPQPASDRRLQGLASAFTPEWLAGQRWFRGKSRGVARVELIDAAVVAGTAGRLLILEATDAAGGASRYLVPAVADGETAHEPRDGDGVWRSLAAVTVEGGELAATRGTWRFTPSNAAGALLPGGSAAALDLAERRLGVQQSNTSVALGATLILKLYRLVEPGENPEVEVNAFLTAAGFPDAPALAGWATYVLDGEPHSALMLQALVPATGDGWAWVLERLADGPHGAAEAIGAISEIGGLTARLHAALASRPATPGFPARRATTDELRQWRGAAGAQLDAALGALDVRTRPRLAAVAGRISAGFAVMDEVRVASVSRIHGDYHLGQLLRTAEGFVVIDFEGEPARTLAERRAAASPLRDLAGMLRSLDYAARTADAPAGWLEDARGAFLAGYGGISADDAALLAAFELEKACYEVRYEANNRPDWVWLPLEALERLSAAIA